MGESKSTLSEFSSDLIIEMRHSGIHTRLVEIESEREGEKEKERKKETEKE